MMDIFEKSDTIDILIRKVKIHNKNTRKGEHKYLNGKYLFVIILTASCTR